jgi:hypothetical protein
MFCFLGVFASPSGNFKPEFASLWPDADYARITSPIAAEAVRLTKMTSPASEGELPLEVIDALKSLSTAHHHAQFLLLRADCWGGHCDFVGVVVKGGAFQAEEKGDQSLRRMILHFGVDIGERQIFAPLRRSFRWQPIRRKRLFAFWR